MGGRGRRGGVGRAVIAWGGLRRVGVGGTSIARSLAVLGALGEDSRVHARVDGSRLGSLARSSPGYAENLEVDDENHSQGEPEGAKGGEDGVS